MKTETTKFYCDRCGAEIENYEERGSVVVYWTDVSLLDWLSSFGLKDKSRVKMDLCQVCKLMLIGYLRKNPTSTSTEMKPGSD
jgi:hypothetical protein